MILNNINVLYDSLPYFNRTNQFYLEMLHNQDDSFLMFFF